MALEDEALLLQKAVRAGVLDADKGTAALTVYSRLIQMGAQFSFGQFLVQQGLLSNMALAALEDASGRGIQRVSKLGDYELVELIGEGQNGAVYRAIQSTIQRPVAVKILGANITADPEALGRFQNEARATAKLSHPNVVQGIDIGCDQGLHYFVMELVEGGSARSLLESAGGKLDEFTALNIVRQAAEGLKAANAVGLVHRDLKPDNILLTREGQAKLVDLGIAQRTARQTITASGRAGSAPPKMGKSGRPLVQAPAAAAEQAGDSAEGGGGGEFWASAPYAAPEIILGLYENNPRSDIYSLGATLFELLAGRPPYVEDSPEQVLQDHLSAPVPELLAFRPDVSPQTASLVSRMLAKKPDDRVPSAAAVVEAITRLLAARPQPQPAARPGAASSGKAPGIQAAQPLGAKTGGGKQPIPQQPQSDVAPRWPRPAPGVQPAQKTHSVLALRPRPASPPGRPKGWKPR